MPSSLVDTTMQPSVPTQQLAAVTTTMPTVTVPTSPVVSPTEPLATTQPLSVVTTTRSSAETGLSLLEATATMHKEPTSAEVSETLLLVIPLPSWVVRVTPLKVTTL